MKQNKYWAIIDKNGSLAYHEVDEKLMCVYQENIYAINDVLPDEGERIVRVQIKEIKRKKRK